MVGQHIVKGLALFSALGTICWGVNTTRQRALDRQLIKAVERNDVPGARNIIARGANVNGSGPATPVIPMCSRAQVAATTPLQAAIIVRNSAPIYQGIKEGEELKRELETERRKRQADTAMLQLLLSQGSNPNVYSGTGQSPRQEAAKLHDSIALQMFDTYLSNAP